MPHLLTWLLLPFSWLYAGIMVVRNWLYDKGWKKSQSFAVPLVNVGNLRIGGTGKTPHVIWLVEELLRQDQRPAILSRGYGRSSTGPRLAAPGESAISVGDEPWQYFLQFEARQVPVAVAEVRRLGVELLLAKHPEITVVVLDDAYQHRAVRPALNILLTELVRPFYTDYVLPAGRLRERRYGAARADIIIVTKCPPDLSSAAQAEAIQHIIRYARPGAPVLFSVYDYAAPQPLTLTGAGAGVAPPQPPVSAVLLTGIAQPGPLRQYLENQGYYIAYHADFPDHHAFQPTDLKAVRAHWQVGWPIFTTAKDATRLQTLALGAALAGLPVYTVPVSVAFLGNGAVQLRQALATVVSKNPALE